MHSPSEYMKKSARADFYNAAPQLVKKNFYVSTSRSSNFYKKKKKKDFTVKKLRPKKWFAAPEKLILPLQKGGPPLITLLDRSILAMHQNDS